MKADIEWVERLDGGVKRKNRITFHGKGNMKWQTKRSDEDFWEYDASPTPEDWMAIEEKVDALYHRGRMPYKHLELVWKLKKESEL